jgi:hypothetical protein
MMSVIIILVYFVLFRVFNNRMTVSEVISLILLLTVVSVFLIARMISYFRYLPLFHYALIFILLPLLLMSQDNPETGKISNYGLNAIIGSHSEIRLTDNYRNREIIWGLTPFYSHNPKEGFQISMGLGYRFGHTVKNKTQASLNN